MTKTLGFSFALLFAACGSPPAPAGAAAPAAPAAPAYPESALASQVALGQQLYGSECAHCHGDAGQGTDKGPPVVGKDAFPLDPRKDAKRDVQFRTAADVFAWATQHMPGDDPGSLTTEQYLAIFAFDLTANGVKLEKPLDGETAAKIVLHP